MSSDLVKPIDADAAAASPGWMSGLWRDNPGLVQLLGLCPLLAVTTRVSTALGLGIATLTVMVATNLMVSLSRRWIHQDLRLPAYVLLIATFVTVVELVFRAWWFELHLRLGIFLPLIVTNCAILARAEVFASRSTAPAAVRDGLVYGAGFMIALLSVGALRELLAYGSLFSDMQILLGDIGGWRGLQLTDARDGFLLAALPPGAFIALGMLVALHRRLTGSGENK